jgi:hypothetical protein
MNWPQKKTPTSVLGLTIDGNKLEAVVLRRTNGSAEIVSNAQATLSLEWMTSETELVGREIRNHLDSAEVRERHCVVGLPTHWAMTHHLKIPEMPEEDVASFLQIEAERNFPVGMDELQLVTVRHSSPGGTQYATQMGVPLDQIIRLEQVLAAAGLKPVSFSLGFTALPGAIADAKHSAMAAVVGETGVELLLTSGGGVVSLRALEGAFDDESGEKRVQADLVARELRITLGQLPPDIRDSIKQINVYGGGRLAQQLADGVRARAKALNLSVEQVTTGGATLHGLQIPSGGAVSSALSLAAQHLGGKATPFQFLPPKPTLWQQLSTRYSSKRLATISATAGTAAALVIAAFAIQQVQLMSLRSEWDGMKKPVREVEDRTAQIRKYRPWFDEGMTSLNILKRVTDGFPEDGVVTAKTIEVRNLSTVTVTGTTRDNQSVLKVIDQLSKVKDIQQAKLGQLRGKPPQPIQFDFTLKWGQSRTP